MNPLSKRISIQVNAAHIAEQSRPLEQQYVFSYTIRIENQSDTTVQLTYRKWQIKDAKELTQVVEGEGVIGEKPVLEPGESYTYTSGAVIQNPPATMEGAYVFKTQNGNEFETDIPLFLLALPGDLH